MKSTTLLCLTMVLLFSCKKEYSLEDSLLLKSVTTLDSNYFSYSYSYNNTRKLTGISFTSAWRGTNKATQTNIARNGSGIIKSISYSGSDLTALGIDSILYNVRYDAVLQRYVVRSAGYIINGIDYADSVIYTSNANEQIVKAEAFQKSSYFMYKKIAERQYDYDYNGNITDIKTYSIDVNSNTIKFKEETTYEYDTNVSPLRLYSEAIIIDIPLLASVMNSTHSAFIDPADPANYFTSSTTYTYNNKKMPVTASSKYLNSNEILYTSYQYQE